MNSKDTDWNRTWNEMAALRRPGPENPDSWNKKADGYRKRAQNSPFTEKLMGLLDLRQEDTVLDVGSGEGSITIPMARKVRNVTAIDYSIRMLELLKEECDSQKIDTIRTIQGAWDDDWTSLSPGIHDICIASRSFLVKNLKDAVQKLNRHARRLVVVVTAAGESAGSTPARRIVGRGDHPSPDYIIAVNYLYSIGILCEVRFIELENTTSYETKEDAFEWLRLSLPDLSPEESGKLHEYVENNCIREADRWILTPRKPVRWAVLSWSPPEKGESS